MRWASSKLTSSFTASDFSHWRARSQHRTRSRLTIHSGRDDQQLAIACGNRTYKKQALQITAGCKAKSHAAVAAINNHDARRNDDATYRKTRKNSIRLRAPTTRTEVGVASRERVESRS